MILIKLCLVLALVTWTVTTRQFFRLTQFFISGALMVFAYICIILKSYTCILIIH